jgi:hypothetical protein
MYVRAQKLVVRAEKLVVRAEKLVVTSCFLATHDGRCHCRRDSPTFSAPPCQPRSLPLEISYSEIHTCARAGTRTNAVPGSPVLGNMGMQQVASPLLPPHQVMPSSLQMYLCNTKGVMHKLQHCMHLYILI